MSNYKLDTICVQGGYKPENGEARTLPIYQSTTYKYDSADHLGDLFDLKADGHMYSRISNPTVGFVEGAVYQVVVSAADTIGLSNVTLTDDLVVEFTYQAPVVEDETVPEETIPEETEPEGYIVDRTSAIYNICAQMAETSMATIAVSNMPAAPLPIFASRL